MSMAMDMYYGDPGSGKTRALIEMVRRNHTLTGKKARVLIGDGSRSMWDQIAEEGGIAGIAEFVTRDFPFTTCQQFTEGWWPVDANDPKSLMRKLTPQEMTDTNLWIYEGASVMGNYMMGDKQGGLAQRAADGESLGGDYTVGFTDSKEYKFGGNSVIHYNLAQRHLLQDILRSKALPGMVIWSAHERMDDGQRSEGMAKGSGGSKYTIGEKKVGPELVGKALTQTISRDFGNTLHFTTVTKKEQEGTDPLTGKTKYLNKTEYRVYTRDHFDPEGIVSLKYIAVNRCVSDDPDAMPEYLVSDKPGQNVIEFYNIVEREKAKKKAEQGNKAVLKTV